MQDRFKFRTWYSCCDNTQEMLYDTQATYDFMRGTYHHCDFQEVLDDEKCINMQCTGLKDKNGKLIYEGDILKEAYFDTDKGEFDFSNIKIGYDEKYCSYYQQSIGYDYKEAFPEFDFKEENIEVIGNIYENPELLKGDFNE